jgi:hypothetical protein
VSEVADARTSTDADGRATAGSWVVGRLAGRYRLQVIVDGKAQFEFIADAIPGGPAMIFASAETPLVGQTGQRPRPPIFQVVDVYGNGVPGATVLFSVTKGAGRVDPATRQTGVDGRTTPLTWLLGPEFQNELSASLANGYTVTVQAVNIIAPTLVWYDLITIDDLPAFIWGSHVIGTVGLDPDGGFISQYSWNCGRARCEETATGFYATVRDSVIFRYDTPFAFAWGNKEEAEMRSDSLLFSRFDLDVGDSYWVYRKRSPNMLTVNVLPFANGCEPALYFCEPVLPEKLALDGTRVISFQKPGPVEFGTVADGSHTLRILNGWYGGPVKCGFWFETTGTQEWNFSVIDGRVPSASIHFGCF